MYLLYVIDYTDHDQSNVFKCVFYQQYKILQEKKTYYTAQCILLHSHIILRY